MKSPAQLLTIILLMLFTQNILAACTKPDKPTLPDPNTAVVAEMVKAQKAVKKYLAAGDKYLGCVRGDLYHDVMVKEMKKVGDSFNASIKAFKARKK